MTCLRYNPFSILLRATPGATPDGVGQEHATELLPRELPVVHVDDRQIAVLAAAVLDEAPQHSAPRRPLVHTLRMVLDLRTACGNLDRHILAEFVAVRDLGGNDLVEDQDPPRRSSVAVEVRLSGGSWRLSRR